MSAQQNLDEGFVDARSASASRMARGKGSLVDKFLVAGPVVVCLIIVLVLLLTGNGKAIKNFFTELIK